MQMKGVSCLQAMLVSFAIVVDFLPSIGRTEQRDRALGCRVIPPTSLQSEQQSISQSPPVAYFDHCFGMTDGGAGCVLPYML